MARGAVSKEVIFNKLQEVFPDAFWEDAGKILRIPLDEDGNRVEVKVTLTAAKNNLGGDNVPSAFGNDAAVVKPNVPENKPIVEPTEEEKANVAKLLASLNF